MTAKIPDEELILLRKLVREALVLAAEGDVEEGYLRLDLGLLWAETPPFDPITGQTGAAEPWSEPLARYYRRALVWFRERCERVEPKPAPDELEIPGPLPYS